MSTMYQQSVHTTVEHLLKSLDSLLVENFTIHDKTLLEKLLTSLQNSDLLLKTIPTSTHCKWFTNVLDLYQLQTMLSKNLSIHLYAFALKYLAILVRCNDRLVELIETHTIRLIINKLDIASNLKESSIFNAYMTLLHVLNTHKQGVEFVFQEGLWENILFAIDGLVVPAKYVEIQSSHYIADLIYRSFEYEIAHCCEPLLNVLFLNFDAMNHNIIVNQQVKNVVVHSVYVKTLILILEKFIGTMYESDACQQIIFKYSLSLILINIKKLFYIYPFLLKNYITLHLLFDYFTVWHQSETQNVLKSIFSYMNIPKEVQLYKKISNLYVQVIRYAHISNTQLAVNAEFEKELIIGQLIPLKKCTEWLKCSKYEKCENFDCCYIIESKCILNYCNTHDSMMNEMAISSILNILDIVPILKQESLDYIVIFFSKLLDQFLNSDSWLEEHQDRDSINNKFLEILSYVFLCWTKILECRLFIENYTQDSFLVPLVQCHSQFFYKPCHNSTLLQNGLKLISTAINTIIQKNIQHTDNLTDFDKLCNKLNDLLLDTRPEIRDSCLQCISSLTVASKSNFGHIFIQILLKENLPTAVLNTLKHDNDPFVRSKALECLEKMVSVLDIWESTLKESNLIAHCLSLMQYESEGIIRRQIVKLITALFFHNELSYELRNEICTVMVHVSTKDPLWEVKTFSYDFWDSVIQKMISKYSKENDGEKLNDNIVLLKELSSIGCLHVFYVALKEEHDLVVQKKAIGLTKKILDFVKFSDFKLMNVAVDWLNNIDIVLENSTGPEHKKSRQIDSADRVLSSITTSNDCELLSNLKIDHHSSIYPHATCLRLKSDVYISIEEFFNFTSTYDFDNCDVKTQWIISTRSGLDSMLDDIIGQSHNCFIDGADLLDCH